jgi:pyridoxamine 5'-phosphate oxidase
MVLATADQSGRPSARVVLCRELVPKPGYLGFYASYESRKGKELAEKPWAAAVFHWDSLRKQLRVEGQVVRSTEEESDTYARRVWLGDETARAPDDRSPVRRPTWVAYRLWVSALELWMEDDNQQRECARWTRTITPLSRQGFDAGAWQCQRMV